MRRIVDRNEFCGPRLALSALGREAPLLGAIGLALKAAERKILPSTLHPSGTPVLEEASGFLQPFLGLARPE
jgi:hypothetical protein